MFKYVATICGLVIFMFAAPLWATEALEGVYLSEQFGQIRVVVKDDTIYRIDLVEEDCEAVSLIAVDGKRWMVGRDDVEMPWEVLDYDAITAYFDEQTQGPAPDLSADVEIRESEVRETVAGVKGRVFIINRDDGDDLTLVLSDNAEAVKVSEKFKDLMLNIGATEDILAIQVMERLQKEQDGHYALLKCTGGYFDFELKSLKSGDFSDSYFALPENVKMMTIEEMLNE